MRRPGPERGLRLAARQLAFQLAAWVGILVAGLWPCLAALAASPAPAPSAAAITTAAASTTTTATATARASTTASATALVLDLVGPINPVTARYVAHGLAEAERRRARVVVLRLDTPGGLDEAMRAIVRGILASPVPVVVYVAPSGARAASAGMFIALAAHVAAMAPNTTIGAAHPVGGGGEEIKGPMADKVTNDAAAYARALASQRGRNARWAEQAVRQSVSLAAEEALARQVVDRVAPSLPDLLARIDGMKVTLAGGPHTLATRGLSLEALPMSRLEGLLLAISHPAIALLLLNIGILGVVFELQSPGGFVSGVVGVICLLLGFYALGMLPVNGVGVALLFFGMALLVAELFVPSYGVLSVGGVAALVLGALMLFQPDAAGYAPPIWLVLAISLPSAALVVAAVAMGLRAQRHRVEAGAEELIGRQAEVREALTPQGVVFLEGELWRATVAEGEAIPVGERVVVDALEGLTLRVHKA